MTRRTTHAAATLALALLGTVALSRPGAAAPSEPAGQAAHVASGAVLEVFPAELRLDDAGDVAGLVVQLSLPDGTTRDVTTDARLTLAHPALAEVVAGPALEARSDGQTTLAVEHSGLRREVPVSVRGAGRRRAPTFENDVLPILTRSGCNTGSCHGTSRGKDGFHLSLFGYDPQGDQWRITREQVGRRVDPSAPEESLLLRKATGAVRHTGGRRVDPKGPLYRTLLAWLEAGAPEDAADQPRLVGLELRPVASVLLAGASQRLVVRALYSDGADRDVTALTTLTTSDASVAALTSDGAPALLAGRRGAAAITARFGDQVVGARALVVDDEPGYAFPDEGAEGWIDRLVNDGLRQQRLRPAPLCDDATFLRRATLDLTGQLPTPAEVEAFLADPAEGKRARVVDEFLERPAFVQLQTLLWAERLMIRSQPDDRVTPKAALAYAGWLEERLAAGARIDAIVRELLTAEGGAFTAPAVNFFHAEPDPKTLTENVAQAFLGLRIQCAQCHDHPFDRWTQDDYYEFGAFFAQVGRKTGDDPRERILFDKGSGELQHPVTKKPATPRFLGASAPVPAAELKGRDRRAVVADWLVARENPWFAPTIANMVWAQLFGVGIVHEPDDVRVSNPPSNPALLDALADRLRATGYDVKGLVREVCASRAYQRTTRRDGADGGLDRTFASQNVRRLRAEVLLDAIAQATDVPSDFKGLPRGGRAVQLADGTTTSDFLVTFGRAVRESPCTCEVKVTPNLGQALHLLNGDTVNRKIKQGKVVPKLLKELKAPAKVVRALYLRTLSRPPTEAELAAVLPDVEASPDRTAVLEDLLWALLNAGEFLFDH